jgi:N-acetylglutamate synthase-like GNAT family acetyltransferase
MDDEGEVHVRTATPQDEDGIMELARLVNKENGVFKMNEDKVRDMVRPSLYLSGGIMGVIGPKDRIEGLVLLRVSQYWYSDAAFLEEMCVYVHPEYRAAKGGRARKLVEFAKKASEKLELPLMIGILSNSRTDAKTRLYERQFGNPAGAFFLYGVKTGQVPDQEIVN